jgi:hypothetical protein
VRAGRTIQSQQALAANPATVRLTSGPERVRRIAWALWLASFALVAVGGFFLLVSASTPIPPIFGFRGADLVFGLAFSTVGVVVAFRHPANPIGRLFGAAGLVFAVVGFFGQYSTVAVLARPGGPLGPEAAWLAQWLWPSSLGAIACVFLLFPDGQLLSRRWRPTLWLAGIAPATAAIGFALDPGPLTEFRVVDNPVGLEAAGALPEVVGTIGMAGLWLALLVGAGASLAVRFRRTRDEERQQLKWVAYAATLAAVAEVASGVSFGLLGESPLILEVLVMWGLVAIPVAAAVAIVRYRL